MRYAATPASRSFGYFCGLIIGDGFLRYNPSSRNYDVCLESTDTELIQNFCDVARSLGFNPHIVRKKRGKLCFSKKELFRVIVSSKWLYEMLRPFKQKDYKWSIPTFLYETSEVLLGFISGLSDAEGTISLKTHYIVVATSKHRENLEPVQKILFEHGIRSKIYKEYCCYALRVQDIWSMERFSTKIGFRLRRKAEKLKAILEHRNGKWRKWREGEVAILEKFYTILTTKELSKMLNRTYSSIYHKASKMKLKKGYE
jgi:intein-encoded DNA endonuclease-like protein